MFFWRDQSGQEIDCIIEEGTRLIPIEIKAGISISTSFFDNLAYWNKVSQTLQENNFLVYAGNEEQKNALLAQFLAGKILIRSQEISCLRLA